MHDDITGRMRAPAIAWAKVIDQTRCIGCHACTVACKSENRVPLSVTRTYVKYVDVGVFPEARRALQVTRCNQCQDAPCVAACPTAAMFPRADGIVDFDKSICIGCKACIAACPYDAIFINPADHSAEKCNFCAHRLDVGLEPACVVVCPTEAILVGDLHDPESHVSQLVHRAVVQVRRPEKGTRPKLFYKGAHQATLDPIAAGRPPGGLFLWSEQGTAPDQVTSGHPGAWNSSAAAVLAYDIPHRTPWDWRVSMYTWTKAIAAGAYLVPLLLVLANWLTWASPLWLLAAPLLGGAFLAITGGLLIWDLEHPGRFLYIFRHHQWTSWLVRGGFIISAYGLVLAGHFGAALAGWPGVVRWLVLVGAPVAGATAVYTAYLFAQARARDLWQNPLAPSHLLVKAALAGSAALMPVAVAMGARLDTLPGSVPATTALADLLAGACVVHLFFLLMEGTLSHVTAHARLASREMIHGRYARFYWAGVVLVALGVAAPLLGIPSALAALIGLLANEHAYVQAGQAVPLA